MPYYYLYCSSIRFQIAFGAKRSKYIEWKASLSVMLVLWWWIVILDTCVDRWAGFDLLFSHPAVVLPLLILGALAIDRYCFSNPARVRRYERVFRSWPEKKRRRWDIATAAVVIGSGLVMLLILRTHPVTG